VRITARSDRNPLGVGDTERLTGSPMTMTTMTATVAAYATLTKFAPMVSRSRYDVWILSVAAAVAAVAE